MSKARPKRELPPPECKAILLCQRVMLDRFDPGYSVIGIIDYFVTFQFPLQIGPLKLFLQLTDGVGTFQISVQIRDTAADLIIARKDDQSIILHDKRDKATFVLDVPPFELPREGLYEVWVLADGQMVERQTVYAYQYREDSDAGDEAHGSEE